MEALLEFSKPLNVELLDQVVKVMNFGQEPMRSQADRVLTALREHSDSWKAAPSIIDAQGCCLESKFFALQLLETVIRFRWRSLPLDQRENVKQYLTKLIIGVRRGLFFTPASSLWAAPCSSSPQPPFLAERATPPHPTHSCPTLLSAPHPLPPPCPPPPYPPRAALCQ